MQNFEFYSAKSIEDCLDYLSENKESCKVIAGGTDLIPVLRKEEIYPKYVLNILEIESLRGITEEDDEIRIGPTTTFTELIESEVLNHTLPLLVQAASCVGSPQIRNRGTIGGNIATASPAADVLPAVLALGGVLEIRSRQSGSRLLPLAEAINAPYSIGLRPDEIITGLRIKKLPPGTRNGFEKLEPRKAMARALMNMSIVIHTNAKGIISELRIVPGAVMPVARRMEEAERILLGKKPDSSLVHAAVEALEEELLKVTGVRCPEYKMPVVKNIFRRGLEQLLWNNKTEKVTVQPLRH
ncbi:MAG: xanthine dehydrogenase family protein subunit M [Desulfobacteria bacterium]